MTLVERARKLRPIIEKAVQSLENEEALKSVELFPEWKVGVKYPEGKRVKYKGVLYSVNPPGHTSQEDWPPDTAVSLFSKVLIPDPNVIYDWEQPDSTNPYMLGDRVCHSGKVWESTEDNNVWEPGVYGWTEVVDV